MPRFVPRERKHKKLARATQHRSENNTNAVEIIPESQQEREARRNLLRQEIRAAQPESKASSKKHKRLEKYIDTKLKKDENVELLKKLEAQRIDTSLLQSSKKLGRVTENKRERLQRALRERDAGLENGDGAGVLYEPRADVESSSDEADEISETTTDPSAQTGVFSTFGSGLKRPLDLAADGRPVIQKRKRRKTAKSRHVEPLLHDMSDEGPDGNIDEEDEDSWEGFETDDDTSHKFQEADKDSSGSSSQDDSDSDSESEQSSTSTTSNEARPARMSAFKAWADSHRNKALDFTPSANAVNTNETMAVASTNFKPRSPSPDPIIAESLTASAEFDKPAAAITISRDESIQKARLELPVVQEEQKIMESVRRHPVVVICGATGSGKTTQIPQMLLENGYASTGQMVGVTQPRRVAATSVASRVAQELGPEYGKRVSHQVRYDSSVGRDTLIKFMTDGVLLREIQQDFILSKYRAVIIDEAHERSVNTDLLIGMLSRIAPLRAELAKEEPDKHRPLKLIIMSATLSQGVDSFLKNVRLWNRSGGLPPVVEAEGRQYPVTVHFARRTRRDFLTEIVEKVAKGHRKLPAGGMLVFLTGQQEIWTVARKLREKLGGAGSGVAASAITDRRSGGTDDYEDDRDVQNERDFLEGEEHQDSDSEAEIRMDDEEDAEFDIQDAEARPQATSGNRAPLKPHILPLYAALPANQQLKVFQAPPHGHRSIILATNVAETSLTIPGVRYVFDSGRVKEKRYDTSTGIQTFEVDWISKASAEQRKGRAGRTGPGHVWRLYSSNVYEEFFADETVPEILRTPLESIVLQLKAMEIENVINFPFPTPPERHQLEIAERLLINLGAIEKSSGSVTKTGKEIMRFPVSPRFGKMLMLAQTNNNVAHVVAVVAALAVGDLIVPEVQSATHGLEDGEGSEVSDDDNESGANVKRNDAAAKAATDEKHQAYTRAQAQLARWDDKSDVMKLLVATALHAEAQNTGAANLSPSDRCQQFSLREKGMEEVQLLRRQLHNIIGREFSSILPQLSTKEINILNQVVAAGFVDQVAIRADLLKEGAVGRKPRRANEVPYRTLFPSTDAVAINQSASPQEDEVRRSVYIHPSSVLAKLSVREVPQYIIYSHLSRGAPSTSNGTLKRTRIHPLTAIGPKALAALAEGTSLLQIGKPINKIEDLPRSEKGKQRRQCWVGLGLKAPGSTSREWPLGAWKVIQWRGTRDWELEKVLAR